MGHILGRTLDADGIPFLALDTNSNGVAHARSQGKPVYYGDASRLEMLRRAHAETARVLVLTMDDAEAAEHVVRVVHSEIPQLPIIARARDADMLLCFIRWVPRKSFWKRLRPVCSWLGALCNWLEPRKTSFFAELTPSVKLNWKQFTIPEPLPGDM